MSGSRSDPQPIDPMRILCLREVEFTYVNWRGETARRRAMLTGLFYGTTEWHPEPQWFVTGLESGRPERHFAVKDMSNVAYAP